MTQMSIARTPAATDPPVIIWIAEDTWSSCVDAARLLAAPGFPVVLLHVTPEEIPAAAHGAYAGLLGRGHPERDPGTRVEDLAAASAGALLAAAAQRLGLPCTRIWRTGRVEREVVSAADGAALLILARDGDRTHIGPRSLGRASRFVVDHSPCPVLLVWPEPAPGSTTIPPAPRGPGRGPGPGLPGPSPHGPGPGSPHPFPHGPGHGSGRR